MEGRSSSRGNSRSQVRRESERRRTVSIRGYHTSISCFASFLFTPSMTLGSCRPRPRNPPQRDRAAVTAPNLGDWEPARESISSMEAAGDCQRGGGGGSCRGTMTRGENQDRSNRREAAWRSCRRSNGPGGDRPAKCKNLQLFVERFLDFRATADLNLDFQDISRQQYRLLATSPTAPRNYSKPIWK
jgi:hypothetical protein